MLPRLFTVRTLFLLMLFGARAAGSGAAEPLHSAADAAFQAWSLRAKAMPSTVTREMGDRGGRAFGETPDPAKTRHYYVAAELDVWDFAPDGLEPVCGMAVPAHVKNAHSAVKLRYFQYTDGTFTTKVLPTPRLGVLGPALRGVVGETLAVTFLNRTKCPLSMHPHGVKYDKDSEGAFYHPAPGLGAAVGPQARFTYVWQLDAASGPLPGEPSSKCWLYHSHVSGDEEANLGLVGCILVTDPARARPDGTPADVDREMISLFMIFNESGADDADDAPPPGRPVPQAAAPTWASQMERRELGSRYAINGYVFGNHPGIEMNEGERVRWHLLALGDEVDVHTAHWHGLRVLEEGRRRTDVVELLPASMKVAEMIADNPGTWLYHCHVAEHMREGMFARMTVHARGEPGVSRAPEAAFFGLREGERSLRIESASLAAGEVRLRGVVSVPEFLAITKTPMRLQLGAKSVTFTPAKDGTASSGDAAFRVLNGGEWGVIYTKQMQFEATLRGPAWLSELPPEGAPLELQIGVAKHRASLKVTP